MENRIRKIIKKTSLVVICFTIPLINIHSKEIYLSNNIKLKTDFIYKKQITNDNRSQDTLIQDQYYLGLIKYIMASRKEIVAQMSKMNLELRHLKRSLYPSGQEISADNEKILLSGIYNQKFSPKLYQDLDHYNQVLYDVYDRDFGTEWIKALLKKSIQLVKYDIELYLWEYKKFPTTEYEELRISPSDEERSSQIKYISSKRSKVLEGENDRLLILPIFKNFTVKGMSEFFVFHKKPNYYFYQYIFASVATKHNLTRYASLIVKKKKRQKARKTQLSTSKFATLLNLETWDNIDQDDKHFKDMVKNLPLLKENIVNHNQKLHNEESAKLTKKLTYHLINKEIDYIKNGFKLLKKESKDISHSLTNFMTGKNLFMENAKDLLDHYSFLAHIPNLSKRISDKYSIYHKSFNPFQVAIYHKKLEEILVEDEIKRNSSSITNMFYGLGFISMFIPYGQIISPTLFAAGAGHSIAAKAIPNLLHQNIRRNFFEVSFNPFGVGETEDSMISYEELFSQNILSQNAKAKLTTALLIEAPLLLIPSVNKIKKTLVLFPGKKVFTLRKTWNRRYRKWAQGMLKEMPKKLGSHKTPPLTLISKNVLKSIITNTNVKISSFYFAAIFSLQAAFDYYGYGYDKNKDQLKPAEANDSTDQKKSKEYTLENEYKVLEDIKLVSKIFKQRDFKYKITHLEEFYTAPTQLSSATWFNLYDGNKTIKVFNTIYFPLDKYRDLLKLSQINRAHKMAQIISKIYLFQKQIESDTTKALLQVNLVEFTKYFMNSNNPMTDYKVQFFGSYFLFLYNKEISLNLPMSMNIKKLGKTSDYWSKIYLLNEEGGHSEK